MDFAGKKVYEGQWRNNKPDGLGKLLVRIGSGEEEDWKEAYDGQWKEGRK